jgi:hypothetical protein
VIGAIVAYRFVHLVLNGASGLDPTAKLILVILAEAANKDSGGVAWVGVGTMAHVVGVDRRTVQRTLRELESAKWITSIGRTNGGRHTNGNAGYSTRYRINVERLAATMAKGKDRRTDPGSPKGDIHAAPRTPSKDDIHAALTGRQRATPKAPKGGIQDVKGDIQGSQRATPTPPEPEVEPVLTGIEPPRANVHPNSTEGQNPFRKFLDTQPEQGKYQSPNANSDASSDGKAKNRLGRKTPKPEEPIVIRETDAQRIARLEANRTKAQDFLAAHGVPIAPGPPAPAARPPSTEVAAATPAPAAVETKPNPFAATFESIRRRANAGK